MKNSTDITLIISLNVVGELNDENNFLHKLLLIKYFQSFVKPWFINEYKIIKNSTAKNRTISMIFR